MIKKEFVEERRSKILEFVNSNSRADIGELAEILSATEATIRRDLAFLEGQGLVYRAHGGVLRREQPSIWQTTTLDDRMGQHLEEKNRIAHFMLQLIHDGDSIMIDGGSTNLQIAKQLCNKKNLLIVSNSPFIGDAIIAGKGNKVILTGGELLKETNSLIGCNAQSSLEQYRTDKAIIGMSGITIEEGCFSAIPEEAVIKRIMSMNSRETIVVADSSKIGTRAFCFVCDFSQIDKLVTDKNIKKSAIEKLKEIGVEVFIV
jgi:DeoR family transcriptional regulator, fructose operon transcriptional repressor